MAVSGRRAAHDLGQDDSGDDGRAMPPATSGRRLRPPGLGAGGGGVQTGPPPPPPPPPPAGGGSPGDQGGVTVAGGVGWTAAGWPAERSAGPAGGLAGGPVGWSGGGTSGGGPATGPRAGCRAGRTAAGSAGSWPVAGHRRAARPAAGHRRPAAARRRRLAADGRVRGAGGAQGDDLLAVVLEPGRQAEALDDEGLDEGDLAAPAGEVDRGQAVGRQIGRGDRPVELVDRLRTRSGRSCSLSSSPVSQSGSWPVGPGYRTSTPRGLPREGLLGQPDPAPEVGLGVAPDPLAAVLAGRPSRRARAGPRYW